MTRVPPATRATISVVIPVKDDADELDRCLEALHAQTRRPDEIIVVDNGSTDASAATATRGGATVVSCEEPGIAAAASRGYDLAAGDIILRLDADCVPSALWVDAVHAAFAARPDVGAVTGGARFIDGPRWLRAPLAAAYLVAYAAGTAPALGHLPLFGSNMAIRRTAWRAVREHVHRDDAEVHDDLDLAFHLGERFVIRYLPGTDMGISIRPFRDASSMMTRIRRGMHTVGVHWPRDFPLLRWSRRWRRWASGDLPRGVTRRKADGCQGADGTTAPARTVHP